MDTDVFKMMLRKAHFFIDEEIVRLESQTDNARYYKVGNSIQADGSTGFMVTVKNDGAYSCGCKQGTFSISKSFLCSHICSVVIYEYNRLFYDLKLQTRS